MDLNSPSHYAIDTKIINLEEIRVYFEYSKDEMTIKIYDKEIFEKQGMKVAFVA